MFHNDSTLGFLFQENIFYYSPNIYIEYLIKTKKNTYNIYIENRLIWLPWNFRIANIYWLTAHRKLFYRAQIICKSPSNALIKWLARYEVGGVLNLNQLDHNELGDGIFELVWSQWIMWGGDLILDWIALVFKKELRHHIETS